MDTQTKVYNIYFDNIEKIVVMEWSGYATSREFRQGTELMLNTLISNKTYKVLADVRDMTIIALEDQQWLQDEFLPRAMDFGFKVLAIVRPQQYFNKVAIDSISAKADKNKLAISFFDDADQAKEWLSLIP